MFMKSYFHTVIDKRVMQVWELKIFSMITFIADNAASLRITFTGMLSLAHSQKTFLKGMYLRRTSVLSRMVCSLLALDETRFKH